MQDSVDFKSLIAQIASPDAPDSALYKLSNLHGEELEQLVQAWAAFPTERLQAMMSRLVEIGEADFEVDFTELFKAGLRDTDAQVRASAIEGLWEVKDVALVRPLIQFLQTDPSIRVREAAATSLSRFVLMAELEQLHARLGEMIWDVLWKAIHSPEEDLSVRRRAVESLAYFDRPETTQMIERAYQDDEPKMRASAVFAMGRSADQEWSEVILSELDTDDPEMRYEATRACGALQLIEATPMLSRLIADLDPEIKLTAIWALGQIGTPEAQRVLEICYEQGDEALQDAADEALVELDFIQGALEFPMYDFDPEDEDIDAEFWDPEDESA